MARTDTLTHFLADVAGAIRTAEGSSGPIQASAFDTRIEALSGGGGGGSLYAPSYISFQYYDGFDLTYETQNLDTSNITSMYGMFAMTTSLSSLDLSNFDTSNVTNMDNMFQSCGASSIDVSSFDTSSVQSMGYMFSDCGNLSSLDLSNFNTTNLQSAYGMFSNCYSLYFLDLRGFSFSNIQDYTDMFSSVNTDCEIIVADDTEKDWMETNFPEMENVKTVAEYEVE